MGTDLSELLTVGGDKTVSRGTQDPYERWRASPTPENMGALLDDLSPTINSEIQRFSGPKPLLRSKARAIAINAVRSYDPASGTKLRSWVTTQMQRLSRYNNSLKPIYTPEDSARKAYAVSKAKSEFLDEHGRDPTDDELADAVGISVKRLRSISSAAPATVNEPEASTSDDSATQEYAVYTSNPVQAAQTMVYAGLSKIDKAIFDMKTGLHGSREYSGNEIAARLGVSPAYVSQRAAAIAKDIRRVSEYGGL